MSSGTLVESVLSTDFLFIGQRYTTIGMLSDDILLEIFDSCRKGHDPGHRLPGLPEAVWDWYIIVHVCQQWRQIVFASPLRLNLQILCTHGTPIRKNLDIWPTFPLHIEYLSPRTIEGIDEDNIIAALERPDRVRAVCLQLQGPQLEKMATVMQVPFPAVRCMFLWMHLSSGVPVLPREFLGRSAPRLQTIQLVGIPFPALPVLLLSTSDLVTLRLFNIPQTGYISPEAMAAALTTLPRLRNINIGFQSPASHPDLIRLPPVTRSVLPALTVFFFGGACKYLEDFMARTYAPRLNSISIEYFNQLDDFEVPQLWQFIHHSQDLSQAVHCFVQFQNDDVTFVAGPTTHIFKSKFFDEVPPHINVHILCEGIDWQVSHIAQALNQTSAASILSNMLHFAIDSGSISPEAEDMDDIEWLQLLRPFSSVRTLFVSSIFAGHISRALEDIAGVMATDFMPALDMLCLEDQPASSIDKFIAARSESGRPVTTVDTRTALKERLTSDLNQ
jgi:hypothetical protein